MLGFTGKDKKFHPTGGSKGSVSEKDLNISVKGNNDVIKVDTKSKSKNDNQEAVSMEEVEKFFNGEEVSKILGIHNGNTEYNSFEHADPFLIKGILDIPNLLDSNEQQGSSPNTKKMIELAEANNAELIGYWIPKASGRGDARVTLTGFKAKISDEKALELKHKLKPDEFMKQGDRWRFWWD